MNKTWIVTPQPDALLRKLPPHSEAFPISSPSWVNLMQGEENTNAETLVLPSLGTSISPTKTEIIHSLTQEFLDQGGSLVFLERTIMPFLPLFADFLAHPTMLDLKQAQVTIPHPELAAQYSQIAVVDSVQPVLSLNCQNSIVEKWMCLGSEEDSECLMLSFSYKNGRVFHGAISELLLNGKLVSVLPDFVLAQALLHQAKGSLDQELQSVRGKALFQTSLLLQPDIPYEASLEIEPPDTFWLGVDGLPQQSTLHILTENAQKTALLDETRQTLPFTWSTIRAGGRWKVRLQAETSPLFCRLVLGSAPSAWKWKGAQF